MDLRRLTFLAIPLALTIVSCGQRSDGGATPPVPAASTATGAVTPVTKSMLTLCALPSSAAVAGVGHRVLAFNPGGDTAWMVELPNQDQVDSVPVAAPNSNTYVRGVSGIYAIGPDGKLLWSVRDKDETAKMKGLVALGDSTVAVTHGDNSLVRYNDQGQPGWKFTLPDGDMLTALPVIAPSSVVYLRGNTTLYAVDPQGLLMWEKTLEDAPAR